MAANQVDFKILPSDQFSVYSPQTRSDKVITYFTLLSKLRGDILSVGQDDDPNDIVSAFYSSVGGTQTLHLVKADGSEITASVTEPTAGTVSSVDLTAGTGISVSGGPITTSGSITVTNTEPDQVVVLTGAGTTSISGTYPSFTITSNDQYVGTVTSVAALTLGTTGTDLSSTVANGTTTPVITLQVPTASAANRGALSSADWTTFNSKQGTITLTTTGTTGAATFISNTLNIPSYTDQFVGTVTSVDLTAGTGITVSGGPITTSGSITVTNNDRGSSQNIFKNIAVAGQSTIVADVNDDTLTIVAGSGVTLTTNNTTDTLTISASGSGGSVTSVGTSAPLTGGPITATGTIGITQSGVSTDGYLSSTDWNTFNNKQSTLLFSGPLVNTSGTVSIPVATTSVSGYLNNTDWTTFNSKQNAITLTTTGTTGAATLIGATLNIPNYADQFVGTVTSVNMSVPTGFAISGNPITTSGTLAVAFDTGYSLPTDASQTTWDTAYNDSITAFAYNTSTAVLTLTQQDAGTLTATITLQPFTTSNLAEGTNLYYTDTRARLALSAGTGITYDSATGVITNSDRGSSQNIFKNIAVAGQSTIIADVNDDTLTVAAGSGVTITTNATTDTITISATGSGGSVTSVGTTAPITGGTITTTGTIGITQSGVAADGYLSSTDWNTFNNKQNALTDPVTGTGTTNYVPKFTSGSAIGNSQIFDDGTSVGIGTAAPGYKLDVSGTAYVLDDLLVGATNATSWHRISIATGGFIAQSGGRGIGAYVDATAAEFFAYNYNTPAYIPLVISSSTLKIANNAGSSIIYHDGTNVGINTTIPATKLEVYGGHTDTTARLYSTGNGSGSDASLDMWASEPGVTYDGSGIGNNVNGHPYYGRRNAGIAQSYIRFYNGGILLNTGSTTASQTVTVLANGNVGIGTTNPGYLLDVSTAVVGGTTDMRVFNSATTDAASGTRGIISVANAAVGDPRLVLAITGVKEYSLGIDNSDSDKFKINDGSDPSSGTNYLTIDSGNVGIGTTSPDRKLDIEGDVSTNALPLLRIHNTNTAWNTYGLIETGSDGVTSGVRFGFWRGTGGDSGANGFVIQTGTNTNLLTTPVTRMFVANNGNVGIGTTSPNNLLNLQKNVAGGDVAAYIQNFNGDTGSTDETASVIFAHGNDGVVGYVGGKLVCGKEGDFETSIANIKGNLQFYTASGTSLDSDVNNIERMRITSAGNVGIGTTSPREKLQVVGNTVIGSAGLNSYKTNLYLTYSAGADETWFRIYLPQDYVSSNNGGTVKVRVLWEGDHATFGAYQEYQISYKTYYPASPYIKFSNVLCTNKTSDFNTGSTYYPPSSTPDVLFYDNSDGYLYVKVKGTHSTYNTARYVEAEIFGRTTSQPTIATTTAPGAPVELTKTIQFLPQEGNIYASGSVGIGTTAPTAKLDVAGAGLSTDFRVSRSVDPTAYFSINAPGGGPNASTFGVNGVDVMTLRVDGNVGIGTTGPTEKLHVAGRIMAAGSGYTLNPTAPIFGQYSSTRGYVQVPTNGQFEIWTGGTSEIATFYENRNSVFHGNVGIGTTSPGAKLDVVSGDASVLILQNTENNFGANQQRIDFYGKWYHDLPNSMIRHGIIAGEHGDSSGYQRGNLKFYTNFDANLVDAMTIRYNGNVGIGNTAPLAKLEVSAGAGTPAFNNGIAIVTGNSTYTTGHGGILQFQNEDVITAAIRGVRESGWGSGLALYTHNTSSGNTFGTTVVERMRITEAGNVGIGITGPLSLLHVAGDARITSGSLGVGVAPNATDGRIDASNDIVAFSSSDLRLKENIKPIENALEKVKSLTGVEFDWKPELKHAHGYEGHDTGVIAQEVQEVMPTAIRTNDTGYLAVRYEKLIGLLIEGMKEQQLQIDELKSKLK
jgi:hypothetical protein